MAWQKVDPNSEIPSSGEAASKTGKDEFRTFALAGGRFRPSREFYRDDADSFPIFVPIRVISGQIFYTGTRSLHRGKVCNLQPIPFYLLPAMAKT